MSEQPVKRRRWLLWVSVFLAILPLLYLASTGPVIALGSRIGVDRAMIYTLYAPILPLSPGESRFDGAMRQYIRFWWGLVGKEDFDVTRIPV